MRASLGSVLAILLLLVMSIMGTTLVVIASNDHQGNKLRDYNQQTFYAAETGIQEAKEYLNQQVQKGVSSRFYKRGRFSPSMEKGVHHFHTLISSFMRY